VPTHWDIRRLKTCLARNDGGVWGDDFDPEGTIVLRSTEQSVGGDWKIDDPARRSLSPSERAAALLAEGDLVITKSSGSELHIGKTSIVSTEVAALGCCFSNFMQRLRCDRRTAPGFVHYILNSPIGREQMVYGSNTSTGLANLNGGVIGNIIACWPPLPEQQAIAGWLDERTQRIDELVAAKRRLVYLLAEQQTALITHAVTMGLDSAATVQTGLTAFRTMPAHWRVRPLKFWSNLQRKSFIDGDWIEAPYVTDSGLRLIQCGNVGTGIYEEQGFRFVSEETFVKLGCTAVRPGDVLICRMRSSPRILAGRACLAPNLGDRMVTAVDNCIVKCAADVDARFLVYLLTSKAHLEHIEAVARGGTRDRISRAMLGAVRLPCPPVAEQRRIAYHLDSACAKLDALTGAAETAIVRLTEYRQALISAAVTGKINVCSIASVTTLTSEQPVHSSLNERDSETKE
jgi:type I restriction enzyme S subunit